MNHDSLDQTAKIEQLEKKLATAEKRLGEVQTFVFGLRCAAARKVKRAMWVREKDRSGLRYAVWGEKKEDLGAHVLIKAEDIPEIDTTPLPPLARDLSSELGAAPCLSSSLPSKRFPPELVYKVVEHTTRSTNSVLCLVSSSVRAIALPRLPTWSLSSPTHLFPSPPQTFLSHLDRVISLEMTVTCGYDLASDAAIAGTYIPISLPHLQHLSIHSTNLAENGMLASQVQRLALATSFLSHLNPTSLSLHPETTSAAWSSLSFLRSVWAQATSTWTRVKSISFIDCSNLGLLRKLGSAAFNLKPADLPRCDPSFAFSWTFTEQDVGIQLHIGDKEEDRKALQIGLAELESDWKHLIRY